MSLKVWNDHRQLFLLISLNHALYHNNQPKKTSSRIAVVLRDGTTEQKRIKCKVMTKKRVNQPWSIGCSMF